MDVLGLNPDLVYDTLVFVLGQSGEISGENKGYLFVQFGEDIAGRGYACLIDGVTARLLTNTNAPTGFLVGFSARQAKQGQYGWVQIAGVLSPRTISGTAAYAPLYTTDTPGVLTDRPDAASLAVMQTTLSAQNVAGDGLPIVCLLYTSPSPRDS